MSSSVEAELVALPKLGRAKLQERWRDLFKTAPPVSYTPDLLARGIAFRLQEKALGGLGPDARKLLGREDQATRRRQLSARVSLRPGNRLVRRWRGRTYVVEVTDAGLVYDGERFGSLSVIARQITGARWSGPKFFGLVP
ncbi:MAG TPA: DUF2924 domain-containing protein [Sphingomicrobium sp.]|nr:DUF2924 domain-containing protein [Sphingomicrobium sp.]